MMCGELEKRTLDEKTGEKTDSQRRELTFLILSGVTETRGEWTAAHLTCESPITYSYRTESIWAELVVGPLENIAWSSRVEVPTPMSVNL